jgi:MFS family permease
MSVVSAGAPVTPPVSAIRVRQFRRYLSGQSISLLGNQVWFVALAWSAVHLGSAATAGILLSLSSLPRLFLMLFGGVIADRHDIRRLMIGSDLLRTVITGVAAAVALVTPGIALLAVLALSFGLVDAVFVPSAGAMQPRLLDPAQYSSGAAIANMANRLALSVGGPLGGLLIALGGVPLALAVDAATFAVSVVTLAMVRPRPLAETPEKARVPYLEDFRAGLKFLVRHPVLGPLTLVILLTNLGFVGPMNIGLAELADHRGWGAAGIGLMVAGFGIGAAAGALLMTRLKIRRYAGVWISLLGAVQGGAIFSTALSPNVAVATLATAVAGLCSGPMAVLSMVLSQTETSDELRGRVSSFTSMIAYGIVPLASAGTGFAIAFLGLRGAYAISGGLEVAGLLVLLAPGFRRAVIAR